MTLQFQNKNKKKSTNKIKRKRERIVLFIINRALITLFLLLRFSHSSVRSVISACVQFNIRRHLTRKMCILYSLLFSNDFILLLLLLLQRHQRERHSFSVLAKRKKNKNKNKMHTRSHTCMSLLYFRSVPLSAVHTHRFPLFRDTNSYYIICYIFGFYFSFL